MVRWAWRLFRREWRQQLLVLARLVAPGQADPPADVSILFRASTSKFQAFHFPSGPVGIEGRGTSEKTAAAVLVLILATVGLLFVGLVAVAGFTVMAQRRLRALGM